MALQRHLSLSRRHFLQGVGACVALPFFEAALPSLARAAAASGGAPLGATTPSGVPVRMAFITFPNGAHQGNWWPAADSAGFTLGKTMEPLAALKSSLQVVGGLNHENATPGNDGGGDHARANATFLTGARARKTDSADIHVGISIDQAVAQRVGHLTRFSSLELSCETERRSGACDTGYSCAYQYNISWQSPTTPMAYEANPRLVFERLFGAGAPAERQKNFSMLQEAQKSVLDVVTEDARALERQLGRRDQQKLDEYLTSVRDLEKRIQRMESFGALPDPRVDAPAGVPADYGEHMDLMYDLLALAFQTDSTRIATLILAADGTNRAFPQIGISEGHHYCSHHQGKQELIDKVAVIDRYYLQRFARFLEKMEQTKDVDGQSMLHNSMLVYGCGNADGNRHTHENLPLILAGGGGGTLTTGRYAKMGGQPATNLFLSMADRMGATDLERLGDSTGRLVGI
jgi:Protein of unknown function (DUF1552)